MTYRTNEEATKEPCPIARVSGADGDGKGNPPAKCRGEACLLWRWRGVPPNDVRVMGAIAREEA